MNARFRRPEGERRYKRMFVIVAEGKVTEQEYFSLLNEESIVHVKCLKNTNNLPPDKALKRVRDHIRKEGLRTEDEAWVVVDKDSWPEEHLAKLHSWAQTRSNYGFALSNPKFEYWLLLHFEEANGVVSGKDCDTRLASRLPNYVKHIDSREFTHEKIQKAIERARQRDTPPCDDWPRKPGSTVYKLVNKILASRTNP